MGFYIRKSISVGPFRFNLSKSGAGLSAGVKGLRIGTGPRGNYIHLGAGGLYYRRTLSPAALPSASPQLLATSNQMNEIESLDVRDMIDSNSVDLLKEMNHKQRLLNLWPFELVFATAVLIVIGSLSMPAWPIYAVVVLSLLGLVFFLYIDNHRKSTVLFYNLDSDSLATVQSLYDCMENLAKCAGLWHIEATGFVQDRKYQAGASRLIHRKPVRLSFKHPPYVKTNLGIPSIPVGRQTLYFFPDRLLVYTRKGIGAVAYSDLVLETSTTTFIECDGAPSDAEVVGRTWQYVNKTGGPDKRFKNNPEYPICKYGQIAFRSSSGLNELIQLSQFKILDDFSKSVLHLKGS